MQIVIDIPDHLYKLLKDLPSDSNEGTIENVLMKAVENGIPLEQIRAEIEQIVDEEQKHDEKWAIGLRYSLRIFDNLTKGE